MSTVGTDIVAGLRHRGRGQLAWVVIGLFRIGQMLATRTRHACGGLSSRFNPQDVCRRDFVRRRTLPIQPTWMAAPDA
ncbi:hypothetical protein RGR602_PC01648 (plasmid) [Rhizobium gallicum bv. gallicum R602sp]|uniref:Uncharacterized protein n=1 Tax=Rhizobium gallicum bv. gallicum R602sp TaxID=1041138 RepID=A0A0B4XGV5_9HYPH|nr:hypothetical protein RGR602_PC01648 [Rhizobium gallicum bv. gallicum R602sp]